MLLSWMLYATSVALLAGAAAWALERAVRPRGLQTRWIWVGGLAISLGLAIATAAFSGRASEPPPPLPAEAVLNPVSVPASIGPVPWEPTLPAGWDPYLIVLWVALSVVAATIVIGNAIRLRRASSGWSRSKIGERDVLVSERAGPAVVGLISASIVLPRWAMDLRPPDRELVLRHEEEHRRAGDLSLIALGLLLVVVLPWNLALCWMVGRLRQAIEIDCDRRVLRSTPDPRRYAHLLVGVAERASAPRLAALSLVRPTPFLERRLRVMTARHPPRSTAIVLSFLSGLFVASVFSLDLIPVRSSPDGQPAAPEVVVAREIPTGEGAESGRFRVRGIPSSAVGTATGVFYDSIGGAQSRNRATARLEAVQAATGTSMKAREQLGRAREDTMEELVPEPQGSEIETITWSAQPLRPITVGINSGSVEDGVISGVVIDRATGEPVPEARISIPDLELGATTNVRGRFLLLNVPSGTHQISVESPGHAEAILELTVPG